MKIKGLISLKLEKFIIIVNHKNFVIKDLFTVSNIQYNPYITLFLNLLSVPYK